MIQKIQCHVTTKIFWQNSLGELVEQYLDDINRTTSFQRVENRLPIIRRIGKEKRWDLQLNPFLVGPCFISLLTRRPYISFRRNACGQAAINAWTASTEQNWSWQMAWSGVCPFSFVAVASAQIRSIWSLSSQHEQPQTSSVSSQYRWTPMPAPLEILILSHNYSSTSWILMRQFQSDYTSVLLGRKNLKKLLAMLDPER